jgi:hypothetical protein
MRYSAALNPLSELVQTRRIWHDASRHAISGLIELKDFPRRLMKTIKIPELDIESLDSGSVCGWDPPYGLAFTPIDAFPG